MFILVSHSHNSNEFLGSKVAQHNRFQALLTFSLLIREDFWLSLDFPSSTCSTFVGGCKNIAIGEKRDLQSRKALIRHTFPL